MIAAFLITAGGVELFRRWSVRRKLLDIPNERSSHTAPTPRGGGLVIVFVCLIFYSIYCLSVTHSFLYGYVAGAILIALVSWLDDLYDVSFIWRIVVHSTAGVMVLLSSGGFAEVPFPNGMATTLYGTKFLLTWLWIVWLTNAYNFMDGIDGIAGMQAVTAGIGWLIVGAMLGFNDIGFYGGIIAFSGLGFLIHNRQPAKIFMGDVGSAFLGYTFAVMPFLTEFKNNVNYQYLLPVAVVLVLLFVSDTVLTLIRRLVRGEKFWQAHRSHLYQQMVISGYSHNAVTALYSLGSVLIIAVLIFLLRLLN